MAYHNEFVLFYPLDRRGVRLKTIFAIAFAFVSHSAVAGTVTTPASEQNKKKLLDWNLTVIDGKSKQLGVYIHFVKQDGKWTLKSIGDYPSLNDINNEEVLVFSNDFTRVQPDYRDMKLGKPQEGFTCMTGILRGKQANARSDYNPCDSSLTSVQSLNVGANVALAVFSFGISAATGTSTRIVEVDPNKVVALLDETGALDSISTFRREKWLQNYRADFKKISSSKDVEHFIRSYSADDPDGLVTQVETMKTLILAKEDEARRNQELRKQEALRAQQLAAEERERARIESEKLRLEFEKKARAEEAAALHRRNTLTAEFRRTIKLGSDTFCGPVINIRGPMIQIAARVALDGFTGEPWLKITEVYPRSVARCSNVMGQPVPVFD